MPHRRTMTTSISRRTFLRQLAVVGAAAPASAPWRLAREWHALPPITLKIGVIESAPSSPAARARRSGLDLGVDDAKRAGALFGGTVDVHPLAPAAVRGSGVSAIVGGTEPAECAALAKAAQDAGVLYLNASCSSDALRGADCRSAAFHVAPSDAMLSDALKAVHAPSGARAVAWDGSLERFGADTLNGRFRAKAHADMDSDAWGAWMAVKVLWECSLRARSTEPAKLAAFLAGDSAQFDGYKGRALSFRAWDHQLRQPVYVFTGSGASKKMVGEAPVAPPGADVATRDLLDRIGTMAARSTCRMTP